MASSLEYRYLSSCCRPPSMSHNNISPSEAAALIMPVCVCVYVIHSKQKKLKIIDTWKTKAPTETIDAKKSNHYRKKQMKKLKEKIWEKIFWTFKTTALHSNASVQLATK